MARARGVRGRECDATASIESFVPVPWAFQQTANNCSRARRRGELVYLRYVPRALL
jgi:hypothetical protein